MVFAACRPVAQSSVWCEVDRGMVRADAIRTERHAATAHRYMPRHYRTRHGSMPRPDHLSCPLFRALRVLPKLHWQQANVIAICARAARENADVARRL